MTRLSLRQSEDEHPLYFKAGRGWGMNLNMAGHLPASSPGWIQGYPQGRWRRGERERERERERENVAVKKIKARKRLIFLSLCRKPIKPQHRTCSVHVGHRRLLSVVKAPHLGHLLKRVLEAWAGK